MSVAEDVNNVYVLTKGGISGQIIVGRDLLGSFQIMHACEEPPEGPAVVIGRHLAGGLTFGHLATPEDLNNTLWLQVGDIAAEGSVEVTGSIGETGLLKITGGPDVPTTVNGSVIVDENLVGDLEIVGDIAEAGLLEIGGDVEAGGRVSVSADLLGTLHVPGDVDGLVHVGGMLGPDGVLEIDGNVRESGTVLVGGSLRGALYLDWLDGAVRVGGDMAGLIDILYCIGDPDPNDVYAGHIHVIGGFEPYEGGPDPLITAFDMGAKANIVFGYDGNNPDHQWAPGAEVIISTAPYPYTENTPSAHVWMTTGCFADVNCDWRIDEDDRAPFYQALHDPWDYAGTYPGLGEPNPEWDQEHPDDVPRFLSGMVLFAGDCNCDGAFDSRDTDPFEVLVLDGLCVHACGGIGRAMDVAAPEETAAAIVASVPSEAIPVAQAVIEDSIPLYTDPDVQDYWATVRDNLGE